MATDYSVVHLEHDGTQIGSFKPDSLHWEIRNCDVGQVTYELPLSVLARDEFAPKRTNFELRRVNNLLMSGRHTSRNLSRDRDSVLVGGEDWLGWLNERIYPFDPAAYVAGDYVNWPKQWPPAKGDPLVKVTTIIEDMLDAILTAAPPPESPALIYANGSQGISTMHIIYPADTTTILDQIKTFSETKDPIDPTINDGFEFDILPANLEFKMYFPDRDSGQPIYHFKTTPADEANGQIVDFDWTDEGPEATWTLGLGQGTKYRHGYISTYTPSRETYYRLDKSVDFGSIANQQMLNRLTAAEGYNNRFPAKRLTFAILNPEFLVPNFYTGGRPRSLIGNRVRVTHDFGYHLVDAFYIVNAILCDVDGDGNEDITLELEMINE